MTEKTDAWMPLWIGAYLADTQHLARDEHGAYLLLLMSYWRAGSALPDDDKRLSAIAKASPKEWKGLRPTMAEFFAVEDGLWTHKRVEKELAESLDRKHKSGEKARIAAQARWGHKKNDAPSNAPSIPQAMHKECPTPSPTPSSLRSEGESTQKRAPTPELEGVSAELLSDFIAVRKVRKAGPLTATAIAGIQREADKAGISLAAAVEACCVYGWQSFNAKWHAERTEPSRAAAATGETAYQRNARLRVAEFSPSIARQAPGGPVPFTIDEVRNVTAIASR